MCEKKCTSMMPCYSACGKVTVIIIFVVRLITCKHIKELDSFEELQFSTKHVFDIPTKSILASSLKMCMEQCSNRKACKGFSFSMRLTLCVLKLVENDDPSQTIELENATGFVFVKKAQKEACAFG